MERAGAVLGGGGSCLWRVHARGVGRQGGTREDVPIRGCTTGANAGREKGMEIGSVLGTILYSGGERERKGLGIAHVGKKEMRAGKRGVEVSIQVMACYHRREVTRERVVDIEGGVYGDMCVMGMRGMIGIVCRCPTI